MTAASSPTLGAVTERWPRLRTALTSTVPNRRAGSAAGGWTHWWHTINRPPGSGDGPAYCVLIGLDDPEQLTTAIDSRGGYLQRVFVVEPDAQHLRWLIDSPAFQRCLGDSRLSLHLGLDSVSFLEDAEPLAAAVGVNGMEIAVSPSLRERKAKIRAFETDIRSWTAMQEQQVQSRIKQRGRPLANFLSNTSWLRHAGNIAEWQDRARGVPAFLVGAGPSLDGCLNGLRLASGRGVVIAVDTALSSLCAAGVAPHILATLDPMPANARHFANAKIPSHTVLAWASDVFGGVMTALPEDQPNVSIIDDVSHLASAMARDLGMGTHLPRSPQTGELAYRLAVLLGCDPIVLTGFDLAFPVDEGITHARNAALCRGLRPTERDGIVEVSGVEGVTGEFQAKVQSATGIGGEPVWIPPIFRMYRERLEALIGMYDGTTIDAGGRGAKKRGADTRPFDDVLAQLPVRDLPDLRPARVTGEEATRRSKVVMAWLSRIQQSLDAAHISYQELSAALQAWPQGSVTVESVLEADQHCEEFWRKLGGLDNYVEVLEPCLAHLILDGLRVVRGRDRDPDAWCTAVRKRHIERAQQFVAALQGFGTFTAHAAQSIKP